jgi:hypothetical protein
MSTKEFIPLEQLCVHYEIEMSFFKGLMEHDLLRITTIEQTHYLHVDSLHELERILRLHQDLYINLEGIDSVLHLLNKIDALQRELGEIKKRLGLYEN